MLHANITIQNKVKKLSLVFLLPCLMQGLYAFEAAGGDDGSGGANNTRVSIGENSTAAASPNGIAIGHGSGASGSNAQAVGLNAQATANSAVAVGTSATAAGNRSDAIGWRAEAHSGQSIAIGAGDTIASRTTAGEGNRGAQSIAIGAGSGATGRTITRGSRSTAIGAGANTARDALNSVAIGTSATASVENSVALGSNSVANEVNTVSVGSAGNERRITNVANGTANHDAVNLSQLNTAYNTSMALTGTTVSVTDGNGDVSVDLAGLQTTQSQANAASITTNTASIATNVTNISTNTAAIAADTDGDSTNELITATTLNGTDLEITEAGTTHTTDLSSLDQSTEVQYINVTANHTAVGNGANASGNNAVATGRGARATRRNAVAIGNGARAVNRNSVALGQGSRTSANNTISVGSSGNERRIMNIRNGTEDHDAVNFSQLNTAYNTGMALTGTTVSITDGNGDVSVDLAGLQTTQSQANAASITTNTAGIATNVTNIANNTADITTNTAAIAADHDGDSTNELITNTALNGTNLEITEAGTIHTADLSSLDQSVEVADHETRITSNTNAINISTLQVNTNTRGIASNRQAIGANSRRIGFVEDKVRFVNVTQISSAIGKNAKASALHSVALGTGANVQNGAEGSVAIGASAKVGQGIENSVALGQYSVASEANTISVGNDTLKRRITNVADGLNPYDAVNMRQYNFLDNKVNHLDGKVNGLGAMTSAMSALIPNGRSDKDTQVGLGLGNYEGETAFALGLFHYVNDDLVLNAAVSRSNEVGTATRIGMTWGF